VPPELDRFILRLLATFQLLGSLIAFFVLLAVNYGGAVRNPALLPLICFYSLYGVVSGVLLYLGHARIAAMVWYAVLVALVYVGWYVPPKYSDESGGFTLLLLALLSCLYLAITALARSGKLTSLIDTD
jgi:hypothetical protein